MDSIYKIFANQEPWEILINAIVFPIVLLLVIMCIVVGSRWAKKATKKYISKLQDYRLTKALEAEISFKDSAEEVQEHITKLTFNPDDISTKDKKIRDRYLLLPMYPASVKKTLPHQHEAHFEITFEIPNAPKTIYVTKLWSSPKKKKHKK